VTTDEKIFEIAVEYIRRASMDPHEWKHTVIGAAHPALAWLNLAPEEKALTSAFFAVSSWYAFTTRRVIGCHESRRTELDPTRGVEIDFPNFKGTGNTPTNLHGAIPRETATASAPDSTAVVRFDFETGKASMAPIYAARYWSIKHPVLHKLIAPSQRTRHPPPPP
jgi:hypothetical protein